MKGNKSSTGGFLFRAIGFLLVGVMLNVVFLNTFSTQAWFTSNMETSMEVTAASTEDIISDFTVDNSMNPKFIILKGSPNLLNRRVLIFFEIEGAIDEYILHIDPVWVEADKSYAIPIDLSINSYKYPKLSNNKEVTITGNIKIKYLNEFINKSKQVWFQEWYLRKIYGDKIIREKVDVIDKPSSEYIDDITNLITYLAKHLIWEDEYYSYNSLNNTSLLRTSMSMSTDVLEEDSVDSMIVLEEVTIERLELSAEQSKIINIISPTLQDYLDRIFNIVENLVQKINEKIMIIFNLEQDIIVLQETEEELNTLLEVREKEIEDLIIKNTDLREQNNNLKQEADELSKEIERLRQNFSSHECPTVQQPEDTSKITNPLVPDETPVQPVLEEPVLIDPIIEAPVIVDPVILKPIIEVQIIEDPVVEDPVIGDPVVEESVMEEPEIADSVLEVPLDLSQ